MAKLIHAASLAYVKNSTLLYTSNAYTDSAKKSIIFTNDGYIVTQGHEYYIGTAAKGNGTTGTSITNGKIKVIDSLGNSLSGSDGVLLPVWKLTNGNVITVSDSSGDWTINHNLRVKTNSDASDINTSTDPISILGFSTKNYQITPNSLSFDRYGHISQTNTGTAIDINKITDNVLNNNSTYKTIYLLGSTFSTKQSTYYAPNKFSGLYATVNADNKVDFYATGNIYAGGTGASNKVITSGDIGNLTGAMRMKGATNDSNSGWSVGGNGPASHKVGDVWYVAIAGTYVGQDCEIGDMLICITDGTTANASDWTVGQANLKVENTDSNGTLIGTSATTIATVAGVDIKVKVNADVNNWRSVYVGTDNSAKLGSDSTGDNALPLKFVNGTNITATWNDRNKTIQFDYTGAATDTDARYTLITANKSDQTSQNDTDSGNSSTYLSLVESLNGAGAANKSAIKITGTGDATVKSNNGVITINSSHTDPTYTFQSLAFSNVYYNGATTTSPKNYVPGVKANSVSSDVTTIKAGSNVAFKLNSNKELTIESTNTWRDIKYYAISSSNQDNTIDNYYSDNVMTSASAGTYPLKFGPNFTFDTSNELDLVWAEVGANGSITYSV